MCRSVRQTPQAVTRTLISPAPGLTVRKLLHAQGLTRARQHHRAHDRSPIDGNCHSGILPVV
jgi:hypothetical protein